MVYVKSQQTTDNGQQTFLVRSFFELKIEN